MCLVLGLAVAVLAVLTARRRRPIEWSLSAPAWPALEAFVTDVRQLWAADRSPKPAGRRVVDWIANQLTSVAANGAFAALLAPLPAGRPLPAAGPAAGGSPRTARTHRQ